MPHLVTPRGRVILPNRVPAAPLFSNSTNIISCAFTSALNSLTNLTMECWVKSMNATLAGSTGQRFVDSNVLLFPGGANVPECAVNGNQVNGSVSLTLNVWTHVAVTYNGTTITLWVNGVSAATGAFTGNSGTASELSIGNRVGNDRPFVGSIAELRYSNSVRYTSTFTPQHAPFVSDGNTLALLHLNEGFGTTCVDSGPNGINGTFGGSTLPTWGPGLF